jgi:uncharacterized SAM-binding protein YcdF (DUF218 family)
VTRKHLAALAFVLLTGLSVAVPADEDEVAKRIKTLVDTGMTYYWTGGDVKRAEVEIFKGITLHGRYDVVEAAFAEASTLAPERLDFRYAVASTQIIQKKVNEAEVTYRAILERDPRAFEAQAWLAALGRVQQDEAQTTLADMGMAGLDVPRAERYRARFARAEAIMAEPLSSDVPTVPGEVLIVALGYALAADGTMQKPLLERLDVALRVAEANPAARVLVSGGQPRNGVTEADLMARWLVEKGVDRDRIVIEDKAKDTVGNVLNAVNLMRRHRAEAVLLVTSASHIRRARTVLEEALAQADMPAKVVPVVALDLPSFEEAARVSPDERLVVYRDLMRVSGFWAYPGLQQ